MKSREGEGVGRGEIVYFADRVKGLSVGGVVVVEWEVGYSDL